MAFDIARPAHFFLIPSLLSHRSCSPFAFLSFFAARFDAGNTDNLAHHQPVPLAVEKE
jgi:hypothetical protein